MQNVNVQNSMKRFYNRHTRQSEKAKEHKTY